MSLPTLYKLTSTGAIQTWTIDVQGSTIITNYGQLNGKLQEARDTIAAGKNIGKSNETTPAQQAQLEAQSQWEKKCKKGYVQHLADAKAGNVDATFIAGGVSPMLAQSYAKHGHKITYPAFVQPKLDGHRCVAVVDSNGKATLWSRTRKPITGVPHIVAALEALELTDVTLDGELYNHDYRDRFEELTSFIKRPEPKPGHEAVQYHVYDMVSSQKFSIRSLMLRDLIDNNPLYVWKDDLDVTSAIIRVDTISVADQDDVGVAHEGYMIEGYEGAMLRNANSLYVEKRSYDLQKIKEFDDAEFTIVDVVEGRGKMAGKAIFVCESGDSTFNVKMKGELDSLAQYLSDPSLAVGKSLTVQFQGYTNDANVPRFPIGLRIREDV